MSDSIHALRNKLRVPQKLSPASHGQTFFTLRCYCDFEGHGRASETWEEHWRLTIPNIPYHWRTTNGWRKGTAKGGMRFHGRTPGVVIQRALRFLDEMPELIDDLFGIYQEAD